MMSTSALTPTRSPTRRPPRPASTRAGRPPTTTVFDPGDLEWNKTYYWRVDEVNAADPASPWKGSVWSFTTADFLVVDDFEAYTDDEGSRIYESWIDGYADQSNGSIVGHLDPPFAERTIVHGGKQSMPLDYNNVKQPYFSEADARVRAPAELDGQRRQGPGPVRSAAIRSPMPRRRPMRSR